jgi:hypothetical protein
VERSVKVIDDELAGCAAPGSYGISAARPLRLFGPLFAGSWLPVETALGDYETAGSREYRWRNPGDNRATSGRRSWRRSGGRDSITVIRGSMAVRDRPGFFGAILRLSVMGSDVLSSTPLRKLECLRWHRRFWLYGDGGGLHLGVVIIKGHSLRSAADLHSDTRIIVSHG